MVRLHLRGSAPAAGLQTFDRSLPDQLPSLCDSPSRGCILFFIFFNAGNENKPPLFSRHQITEEEKKSLPDRG